MQRDIWGVFHDGILAEIDGTIPGDLKLQVQIEYLRRMFDEEGGSFTIELDHCSRFCYSEYDAEPTEDLAKIQAKEIEILSVESEDPLVLNCVMGTLDLEYKSMKVLLPSGFELSDELLVSASEKYWHDWRERTKRET
jgi:hypothetical protein